MKSKIMILLMAGVLLLPAALFGISVFVNSGQYQNLFLVVPMEYVTPSYNPRQLEELCEEEFLISYEIPKKVSVQTINSKYEAVMVGTNSCYTRLMDFRLSDGSFFTKSAWDAENRHMVLNETAASQFFGSIHISGNTIKMDGETWLITGVIKDNDEENANLYVPSSIQNEQMGSFRALMDKDSEKGKSPSPAFGGKLGKEYIKNELKEIGIYETKYDLIDISTYSAVSYEQFQVALMVLLCAVFLLFIRYGVVMLFQRYHRYKEMMGQFYLSELITSDYNHFLKTIGICIGILTCVIAILYLSVRILTICLGWQVLSLSDVILINREFTVRTAYLQNCYVAGNLLFYLYLAIIIITLLVFWKWRAT